MHPFQVAQPNALLHVSLARGSYSHGTRPDRPHGGGSEREPRWREERFQEAPPPPVSRSRPDEWRDPWRRSVAALCLNMCKE